MILGQHRHRARGMILGLDFTRQPRIPIRVRLHSRARRNLFHNTRVQGLSAAQLARKLKPFAEHPGVSDVREVARVDHRWVEGVCGVDVEVALGKGVLKRGLDRDCVCALGCTCERE
jgi:hypothetical protein